MANMVSPYNITLYNSGIGFTSVNTQLKNPRNAPAAIRQNPRNWRFSV